MIVSDVELVINVCCCNLGGYCIIRCNRLRLVLVVSFAAVSKVVGAAAMNLEAIRML